MVWIESLGSSGGGGGGGTPITPSDVTPVQLTSGQTYEAQGNGYAIQSNPSIITPSNASPAVLTSGNIYKMSGGGAAIASYISKTPGNTPSQVTSGNIYKMTSNGGYLIKSYQDVTPSAKGTYAPSGMIRLTEPGHVTKYVVPNFADPDVVSQSDLAANGSKNITVTEKPRLIISNIYRQSASGYGQTYIYDSDDDKYLLFQYSSSGYNWNTYSGLPGTITAVTASNVTIKNLFGSVVRNSVAIYY